MADNGSFFGLFLIAAILALSVGFIAMGACDVNHNDAHRVLAQEGVQNPHLTGYDWFACGRDDSFSTGFTGVKNGRSVRGTICGGWMKGYTVRYQ